MEVPQTGWSSKVNLTLDERLACGRDDRPLRRSVGVLKAQAVCHRAMGIGDFSMKNMVFIGKSSLNGRTIQAGGRPDFRKMGGRTIQLSESWLPDNYPVVEGATKRAFGVPIFPTNIPYFMGSRLELLRVSQASNSLWFIPPICGRFGGWFLIALQISRRGDRRHRWGTANGHIVDEFRCLCLLQSLPCLFLV